MGVFPEPSSAAGEFGLVCLALVRCAAADPLCMAGVSLCCAVLGSQHPVDDCAFSYELSGGAGEAFESNWAAPAPRTAVPTKLGAACCDDGCSRGERAAINAIAS
jgi:hypothetical protein